MTTEELRKRRDDAKGIMLLYLEKRDTYMLSRKVIDLENARQMSEYAAYWASIYTALDSIIKDEEAKRPSGWEE